MTQDVKYFSKDQDKKLVQRLLRALALEDKFVVSVGGMSDTAGHGNRASEAYPQVMAEALEPVFVAAGIQLVVRNFAMGGVPSFPNSVCLGDFLGVDTDLVVWDFRMVEHDDVKGELYIRQAMLLPRSPAIMFKRENRYLGGLASSGYGEGTGLHALDETKLFNQLHQSSEAVKQDKFCKTACTCPGQVRWHAGWKMQRLRGLQMTMVYARCLSKALAEYKALVEQSSLDPATSRDWTLVPPSPDKLPPIKSSALKPTFASSSFRCGLAWNPHHGKDLTALIDTSSAAKGGTQWKVVDPNKRISDSGKKCGYIDDKAELEGTVDDGWVYFVLKGVKAPSSSDHDAKGRGGGGGGGMVGFCADFKKDARLTDYEVLVLLNGEEVQEDMEFWLDARTLGISIQCYGTSKMVRAGENNLGFRVMQRGITFKLTHVIWR